MVAGDGHELSHADRAVSIAKTGTGIIWQARLLTRRLAGIAAVRDKLLAPPKAAKCTSTRKCPGVKRGNSFMKSPQKGGSDAPSLSGAAGNGAKPVVSGNVGVAATDFARVSFMPCVIRSGQLPNGRVRQSKAQDRERLFADGAGQRRRRRCRGRHRHCAAGRGVSSAKSACRRSAI